MTETDPSNAPAGTPRPLTSKQTRPGLDAELFEVRIPVTRGDTVSSEEAALGPGCGGDPGAFDQLVTPHLPRAYRFAYLITHDPHSASDALQEALVRAYHSLGKVKPGRPFYPWFARVVVNEALKQARRRERFYRLAVDRVCALLGMHAVETPESSIEAREEHERVGWPYSGSLQRTGWSSKSSPSRRWRRCWVFHRER